MNAAEWCEVCQKPMVHRRGVLICPTCDLIRFAT